MSHPEAGGKRGGSGSAGQLCPCSLHPSVPLQATPPAQTATIPRARGWHCPSAPAAKSSPARERLPRRGRRFADLRLFSQLPHHILPGSHVCRSQALLSWLPAPGPVPGWKQHPDGAIFSHFWGGGEEGLGKKLLGPGKQREGADLKGVWSARPRFAGNGGLGRETEARSIPPGQCPG